MYVRIQLYVKVPNMTFISLAYQPIRSAVMLYVLFFFSSRRRHTSWPRDWNSDVCSSDLLGARGVRVGTQVEVGAVGDAHQLAPLAALEAEAVLQVDGGGAVMGALGVRDVEAAQVVRIDAQIDEPLPAGLDPFGEVAVGLLGRGEVLDLHLFELAGAEDEVARCDLVAERLADLADAEGWLHAGGGHHVQEVHEDALSGLRTQVVQAGLVVDRPEIGLDQARELLRIGVLATVAAVGAGHLGQATLGGTPLLRLEALDQMVLTETVVAALALHQRGGGGHHVPGGLPHPPRKAEDRQS